MIRSMVLGGATLCAVATMSVAHAAHVDLSLDLAFNSPSDRTSGGTWTAVVKADQSGLAGLVFLAEHINNDAAITGEGAAAFEVFQSQQVGIVIEVVAGDNLDPPTLDVGVIGGSFPTAYVEPAGIVALAGQPDLGSFAGGARIATGTFGADLPDLIEAFEFLQQGANVFDASGAAIEATLNTTVRAPIPEPAALALVGIALIGSAVTRRRAARVARTEN